MSDFSDEHWMHQAMTLARRAEAAGEVPVGAVLVRDGECLAEGWNRPIASSDPTAHAEITTLRQAGEAQGNYRLPGTTLYVTLEPCPMCMGAMVHARVQRLVFGAFDSRSGAATSVFRLGDGAVLNHRIEVEGGVLESECAQMLQGFFRKRRGVAGAG